MASGEILGTWVVWRAWGSVASVESLGVWLVWRAWECG